jgi:tetratricopeptide (TPR) repeat protein
MVQAQPSARNWYDVQANSDYYLYRYHTSYAQPSQLLRTVEHNHLGLGQQRLREKSYSRAFNEFTFILTAFPNHPQALLGMVELCNAWRSPNCGMEERFAKAIAVNPDAAGTYVIQGIYLARIGKNAAAIESYKRAVALQPDLSSAHYNLGLAYFEAKQYSLSNEYAQKAYSLGFQLPGLRDKLQRAGHWKPLESLAVPPAPQAAPENAASKPSAPNEPSSAPAEPQAK